ncbi:MAG: hypothetical protein QOE87_3867 [Gaiellales bacterium]|nr:hypothetical protein [Gaiellales bacterium]
MRREAPAVVAVIIAVAGVLAPLTLGGRLASSADLDAFYAPFASFLHDRLAAGDIPYWAPGAFSGQPFLADAQSGVTYPPMLLASWLLDPIDALRAVATFHYLIAALGAYALARQLRASRTGSAFGAIAFAASGHLVARSAALGLLGGAAWLAPALAFAEMAANARPSRRAPAIAGLAFVLGMHLASGSQQLAALTLATCVIWLVARAGARGAALAAIAIALALGLAAVALLPRLEMLRYATASGYVDPDGIGSFLFGDRRGLVGRFGVSSSEIATLYLGAATPALALIGWRRGARDGVPVRLLAALIAFSLAWATGLVGWLMDPLPLVRTVAGHEPVRGIVLGLLCLSVLAAFALPEPKRWPSPVTVGALGLVVGVLAGGTGGFALSYVIPLAGVCAVLAFGRRGAGARLGSDPDRAALAALALLLVLGGDLAWQATHQDQPLRWLRASQIAPEPSGSAAFLLARQRAEGPFRIATAAPEPTLVHQLGAHRSKSARALLLDQEALRLGLEDVSGYNPVHLKRYDRLMRASNGGRKVDRHFELALRYATPQLRSLAVRYYVSPPGTSPPGLPVVYRDRLSVVTRDDAALPFARIVRPGQAPRAARIVSRAPDRIEIAPPGPGRLVVADLVYPGWRVKIDGRTVPALAAGDLRAVDVPPGARRVVWTFTPPGARAGLAISFLSLSLLLGLALSPWLERYTPRGRARRSGAHPTG